MKLSAYAFCTGLPGWMCASSIRCSMPHARKCREVSSVPLSILIRPGHPRCAMTRSRARVTPARQRCVQFQSQALACEGIDRSLVRAAGIWPNLSVRTPRVARIMSYTSAAVNYRYPLSRANQTELSGQPVLIGPQTKQSLGQVFWSCRWPLGCRLNIYSWACSPVWPGLLRP